MDTLGIFANKEVSQCFQFVSLSIDSLLKERIEDSRELRYGGKDETRKGGKEPQDLHPGPTFQRLPQNPLHH